MNSQQHFPGVTLPAPIRTGLTVHECYVDSGDAAKFLKVARSTVAHWARQGMIPLIYFAKANGAHGASGWLNSSSADRRLANDPL